MQRTLRRVRVCGAIRQFYVSGDLSEPKARNRTAGGKNFFKLYCASKTADNKRTYIYKWLFSCGCCCCARACCGCDNGLRKPTLCHVLQILPFHVELVVEVARDGRRQ